MSIKREFTYSQPSSKLGICSLRVHPIVRFIRGHSYSTYLWRVDNHFSCISKFWSGSLKPSVPFTLTDRNFSIPTQDHLLASLGIECMCSFTLSAIAFICPVRTSIELYIIRHVTVFSDYFDNELQPPRSLRTSGQSDFLPAVIVSKKSKLYNKLASRSTPVCLVKKCSPFDSVICVFMRRHPQSLYLRGANPQACCVPSNVQSLWMLFYRVHKATFF